MTEFGSMALIDEGAGGEEGVAIPLPGVKRGVTFGFPVFLLVLYGSKTFDIELIPNKRGLNCSVLVLGLPECSVATEICYTSVQLMCGASFCTVEATGSRRYCSLLDMEPSSPHLVFKEQNSVPSLVFAVRSLECGPSLTYPARFWHVPHNFSA